MSSTTLMTFLLCTDPSVRSVQLLGSWDNFSKPYSMERDKRVGAGQWRGCHKFTDIPYEGPSNGSDGHAGGLRMGGTYWYYYLLDGDVEYYNEAEPATTKCPSLPGQPVNILHVPVILPDSRKHGRDGSVSSQKSNYRTMDPEDKFLNPRQPPKPKIRLSTSPQIRQHPTPEWLFLASVGVVPRSTSQPASPNRVKRDGERDGTSFKPARSLSPPRSRRVRAAFRHMNGSSSDIEDKDRPGADVAGSSCQPKHSIPMSSCSRRDDRQELCSNRPELESSANSERVPRTGTLPFRRPTPADIAESSPLSIQQRRAMRSRSRGDSPNGNPLRLETRSGNGKRSSKHPENTRRSPTAKEAISQKGSALLLTAKKLSPKLANFKEKRLPTLPNSPSSVMDEALRDIDAQERALDMEMLCSHFSNITTTTDESTPSNSPCERSHFSEWSTDSDTASPESMTSSSTFNVENHSSPTCDSSEASRPSKTPVPRDYHDPQTPHLAANSKPPSSSSLGDGPMNHSPPHLSISEASPQLDIPDICVDDTDQVESNPKRHATFFAATEPINALGLASPGISTDCDQARDRFSSPPGDRLSTTMQELMDELGYLGDTIESGDGRV